MLSLCKININQSSFKDKLNRVLSYNIFKFIIHKKIFVEFKIKLSQKKCEKSTYKDLHILYIILTDFRKCLKKQKYNVFMEEIDKNIKQQKYRK